MNKPVQAFFFGLIAIITIAGCSSVRTPMEKYQSHYQPDNQKLYDTIVYQDSVFFQAYNTCNINLKIYGDFYSDSIEFYHDKGGLQNNKKDIIEATRKNICGKVTRELVKGSIEVYPIKDFGAVELGLHKFHNNTEPPTTKARISRFVIIWQFKNNQWKITRVVSLH